MKLNCLHPLSLGIQAFLIIDIIIVIMDVSWKRRWMDIIQGQKDEIDYKIQQIMINLASNNFSN